MRGPLPRSPQEPAACRARFSSRCASPVTWTSSPGHKRRAGCRAALSSARADGSDLPPLDSPVYDKDANSAYWSWRPWAVVARGAQIALILGYWFASAQAARARGGGKGDTAPGGLALRAALTDLGPAFVKIGQALATRSDIVPAAYIKELERLQDRIPPFATASAMEVVTQELGVPPSEIFSEISAEPVAAASLGQVYRARLRGSGDAVAVKVQRPGVLDQILLDIYILRIAAGIIRKQRSLNTDLPAVLDEWAGSLIRELDYRQEARNGARFRDLFGHFPDLYVPHMYGGLTTRRVLVMEWIDGKRLRSVNGNGEGAGPGSGSADDLRLVEVGVRCSLEQVINQGYYHADPHPGNLMRQDSDGSLVYLDFGMMGTIERPLRTGLIKACIHLVNREFDLLARDFVTLGLLPPGSNREKVVPALTKVFLEAVGASPDTPDEGDITRLSFTDLTIRLGQTMYEFQFRIPPYYTLLIRSLAVLEGIAIASDPNYKVVAAAYPWIAKRLLTDSQEDMRQLLRSLLYDRDQGFNFKRLQSLLVNAVSVPGDGWSAEGFSGARRPDNPLVLLLTPEASYVRNILLDELAKGIDAAWRMALDGAVDAARDPVLSALEIVVGADPGGSPPRGNPLSPVLRAVQSIPRLAEEEDLAQIEGLQSLAAALEVMAARSVATGATRRPRVAGDGANGAVWGDEAGSGRAAGSLGPAGTSAGSGAGAAARGNGNGNGRRGRSDVGYPLPRTVPPRSSRAPSMVDARRVQQASLVLSWVLQEAERLPPAARQEVLRIPLQLVQMVASRVTARLIRSTLLPAEGPGREARPDMDDLPTSSYDDNRTRASLLASIEDEGVSEDMAIMEADAAVAVRSRAGSIPMRRL